MLCADYLLGKSFVLNWANEIDDYLHLLVVFFSILLCAMCGDEYPVELILGPLLHHHYCYSHPEQHETIMLEAYLGNMKRTVSITLGSYHS